MLTNNSDRPSTVAVRRERPLWVKALAVIVIQTVVMQPATVFAPARFRRGRCRRRIPAGERHAADGRLRVDDVLQTGDASGTHRADRLGRGQVLHDDEERLRHQRVHAAGAAFNPLWYNPTITYRPWNDNNKPARLTASKGDREPAERRLRRFDQRCRHDQGDPARHAVPRHFGHGPGVGLKKPAALWGRVSTRRPQRSGGRLASPPRASGRGMPARRPCVGS